MSSPLPDFLLSPALTPNALTVVQKRFMLRDPAGNPLETPEELFWRVASHVARAESSNEEQEYWTRAFYDILARLDFLPNSPTFTGSGTPLNQLAACFVLPISDNLGTDESGIMSTLRHAALIQQTGGGNGFSFSRLREAGATVKKSNGKSTGPIGFMRVYDAAFGTIAQGGCLVPETLVQTDQGLLRLEEIYENAQESRDRRAAERMSDPHWIEHRLTVRSLVGDRISPAVYDNGEAPVWRVTLEDGLSVTGTKNHKIAVCITQKGQGADPSTTGWKKIQDLAPGDHVAVHAGLQCHDMPLYHLEEGVTLDTDLAYVLGMFMSAGDYEWASEETASWDSDGPLGPHPSGIVFRVPWTKRGELFKDLTTVVPGLRLDGRWNPSGDASFTARHRNARYLVEMTQEPTEDTRGNSAHVAVLYVKNAQLALLFHRNRIVSLTSPDRPGIRDSIELPRCVRQSPARVQCAFLHGLFGSRMYNGDGDAREDSDMGTEGRLTGKLLRCSSRILLDDLCTLFVTLGGRLYRRPDSVRVVQPPNLQPDSRHCHYATVISVEREKHPRPTLDLEVEVDSAYVANGIYVHNSRRGANMAVLRVDHPDIEEFIACKANSESAIVNFNISVGVTDEFMEAVEQDREFSLVSPATGTVTRTVNARELWSKVVHYAHHNGEPGVLFLDAANRTNPVPHLYELEATNPCIPGWSVVMTHQGPALVEDLIGEQLTVRVNRTSAPTTEHGFFQTGTRDLFSLRLVSGHVMQLTRDHKVMARSVTGEVRFVPADELTLSDQVCLSRVADMHWGKRGAEESARGYLMGMAVSRMPVEEAVNAVKQHINRCFELLGAGQDQDSRETLVHGLLEKYGAPCRAQALQQAEANASEREIRERRKKRGESRFYRQKQKGADGGKSSSPASLSSERTLTRLLCASSDLQAGFVQALVDIDGVLKDSGSSLALSIPCPRIPMLDTLQALLLQLGIFSARVQGTQYNEEGQASRLEGVCIGDPESIEALTRRVASQDPVKFFTLQHHAQEWDLVGRPLTECDPFWSAFSSLTPCGTARVYDCQVPGMHCFAADGFVVHNCGEQWLGPYENCCLGSINLRNHLKEEIQEKEEKEEKEKNVPLYSASVDWERLAHTTKLATRFLDNVVTMNGYVPAIPQLREAAERCRRIGLGIAGLADVMFALGVRYGDARGEALAAQIMEFVRYHSLETSVKLARERGMFPAFHGSALEKFTRPVPLEEQRARWTPFEREFNRPSLDWDQLEIKVRAGVRNAAQTTIAPTGSLSTVMGVEGYGCEPAFALAYIRNMRDGDRFITLSYASPALDQVLKRHPQTRGWSEQERAHAIDAVLSGGSVQSVAVIPQEIRHVFVTANDIAPEEHVRMQAALQVYVDNSISKTCNLPSGATESDVARCFELAHRLRCKGLTVYVTGSRNIVVLETKEERERKEKQKEEKKEEQEKEEKKEEKEKTSTVLSLGGLYSLQASSDMLAVNNNSNSSNSNNNSDSTDDIRLSRTPSPSTTLVSPSFESALVARTRDGVMYGRTVQVPTPLGKVYLTLNEDAQCVPFEVFVNISKAGSETAAIGEAFGRLLSYILRMPSIIPQQERLAFVVEQLKGIGGRRATGVGKRRILSLPDGIARALEQLTKQEEREEEKEREKEEERRGTDEESKSSQRIYDVYELCPSCGDSALRRIEGCKACVCGYSEC